MATAELILDAKVFLGEGPLWDVDTRKLWWINIFAGELFCFDPETGENQKYEMGQQIGTVVLQESGGVAVALENGFYSFDPVSTELELIVDPESEKPENRFNDGKCDPAGRFWAGTMEKIEEQATGSLYCLEGNGEWHCKETGIFIANGITWTSDQRTMYYIDSPTRQIDAYDYDLQTGSIGNRRTVIEVPEGLGYP
ncbi:MAG: SMP-30/gluconolactonase/LRE family protein, partial [Planctomycetota bacterium]|nr:SMP-30/gluconolactonase/LRE family protein [Planctomycetota bacterium]